MINDEAERLNKKVLEFCKMVELLFNVNVSLSYVTENKKSFRTPEYYRITIHFSRNEIILFNPNEMLLCTDEQIENKFWDYLFRLSRKVNESKKGRR